MSFHFALLQIRASERATRDGVLETLERFWRARGMQRDDRNPLRLRPNSTEKTGRIGYAVSAPVDGWITVAESERYRVTAGLAKALAGELTATVCEYEVSDAVNQASLTWHGEDREPARNTSGAVLERAAKFPYGRAYFDHILAWSVAERRCFATVGLAKTRGNDVPAQAIWSPLERGDSRALKLALDDTPLYIAREAIAAADLGDARERAAIVGLDLRKLTKEIVAAFAARAALVDDEPLLATIMEVLPNTKEVARMVVSARVDAPKSSLMLYERFGSVLGFDEALGVVAAHAAELDLSTLLAWENRTPTAHEAWMQIWLGRGELERAVDHVERGVARGLDLAKLRDGGGVPSELHKRLSTIPRYRALFTAASPTAVPSASTGSRERQVEHPTFGIGKIVKEMGDTLEIEFKSGGNKVLKRRFVREL
jgi:hypothetical protein